MSRAPAAGDEELAEQRHHAAGGRAEQVGVDRDVAPAEDGRGPPRRRSPRPAAGSWRRRRRRPGRNAVPTAYAPARGQVEVDDGAQERVRDLDQDAGAVAGVRPRRRRRRGGRGCAARSAPGRRCRGWPRRCRVATKATPQASCSNRGSYSPWAGGPADNARIDRCSRRRCHGRGGGRAGRARQGGRGRHWPKRGQASKRRAPGCAASCPADRCRLARRDTRLTGYPCTSQGLQPLRSAGSAFAMWLM